MVCTAGRCRSPIAASLLTRAAQAAGLELSVAAVGFRFPGEPMPAVGVDLMRERGIDLAGHRSTPVTLAQLEAADLVLVMSREHTREVMVLSPTAAARTFTLKEFVRRAGEAPPRGRHQRWAEWLQAVAPVRQPGDVLGPDPDDDIPDPFGQRVKVWAQLIDDIDGLVQQVPPLILGRRGDPEQAADLSAEPRRPRSVAGDPSDDRVAGATELADTERARRTG